MGGAAKNRPHLVARLSRLIRRAPACRRVQRSGTLIERRWASNMSTLLGDAAGSCGSERNNGERIAAELQHAVEDNSQRRKSGPPEAGALPPPLSTEPLVREAERDCAGMRIGGRLHGALDMSLRPRKTRPFAELMAGLAAAGLPCGFSLLIEGGGLHRLDAMVW